MATATVILGHCPPFWRDLIRRLLLPDFDVVQLPPAQSAEPSPPVAAYLLVGDRPEDAAWRSAATQVPLVLLSRDGRRATQFLRGAPARTIDDVSARELRRLLGG